MKGDPRWFRIQQSPPLGRAVTAEETTGLQMQQIGTGARWAMEFVVSTGADRTPTKDSWMGPARGRAPARAGEWLSCSSSAVTGRPSGGLCLDPERTRIPLRRKSPANGGSSKNFPFAMTALHERPRASTTARSTAMKEGQTGDIGPSRAQDCTLDDDGTLRRRRTAGDTLPRKHRTARQRTTRRR